LPTSYQRPRPAPAWRITLTADITARTLEALKGSHRRWCRSRLGSLISTSRDRVACSDRRSGDNCALPEAEWSFPRREVGNNLGTIAPKHRGKRGSRANQKAGRINKIDVPALSAKPPSPVQIRAAPPKSFGKITSFVALRHNLPRVAFPSRPRIASVRECDVCKVTTRWKL
jgi:hypothetical protein